MWVKRTLSDITVCAVSHGLEGALLLVDGSAALTERDSTIPAALHIAVFAERR